MSGRETRDEGRGTRDESRETIVSRLSETAVRRPSVSRSAPRIAAAMVAVICLLVSTVPAQDDALRLIETKRIELKAKEDALTLEEQRLSVIRNEVDAKIEAYAKLLAKVEAAVKKVEEVKGERIENVVKAYEVMPAEDAAARLSVLDNDITLQIMTRMKSKKVGAIIAVMEPRKAAALTKSMTTLSLTSGK